MRAFISIFSLLAVFSTSTVSLAAFEDESENTSKDPTMRSGEEDYRSNPYTDYGDFNMSEQESKDVLFFQYGRFFGAGLGLGYHGATGNRGILWQGGFPLILVKLHYWFNFNLALQLGIGTASHFYEKQDSFTSASSGSGGANSSSTSTVNVGIFNMGVDLKYYFDTANLAAPVAFANPYLLVGVGGFNKTETSTKNEVDTDNAFGFNGGAGLEFVISPKSSYFVLEGKTYFIPYRDRYSNQFDASYGLKDLDGLFYSVSGNIMFTW